MSVPKASQRSPKGLKKAAKVAAVVETAEMIPGAAGSTPTAHNDDAHPVATLAPPAVVVSEPEAAAPEALAAEAVAAEAMTTEAVALQVAEPTDASAAAPPPPAPALAADLVIPDVIPDDPEAPSRGVRDDPRLDRRIIEGMLGDREPFLRGMAAEGYSQNAVLRRAAELGLSEAMVRQVKGVAADLAGERPGRRGTPTALGARTCLACDRIFLSSGPGNRLCMRCRGGDAGMAQL